MVIVLGDIYPPKPPNAIGAIASMGGDASQRAAAGSESKLTGIGKEVGRIPELLGRMKARTWTFQQKGLNNGEANQP